MSILSKLTTGVVGLIVLGVGGWAAAAIPSPLSTGIVPLSESITPDGINRHLVCAGNAVGHLADSADATPVGNSSLITVLGQHGSSMVLAGHDNGAVIERVKGQKFMAATEVDSFGDSTMVGFLATECGDALNEQWVAGGSTETGRETNLVLSNGTDVDARVDLEIWGTNGLVEAPGSKGIVVPALSQRVYSIAGFAPDEPSPAVHVVSTGAAIWATLQVTAVRGLVPGGVDRIGSISAPAATLVFPTVRIPSEASIGEVLSDPAYSDITPAIRLLNPNEVDATATITLVPADGGDPQSVTATVSAGLVSDIALADFVEGDWSIIVTADQPLVSAIRTGFHDPNSGVTDIAWESPSPIYAGTMAIAVPSGSTLGIVNPRSDAITVEVSNGDVITAIEIPAGGSVVRPVDSGQVVLKSTGDIAASIVIETGSGIAIVRALSEPRDAGNVVVTYG